MWSIISLLFFATGARAVNGEQSLKNAPGYRGICQGMFGPKDSSGPYTPSIDITFPKGSEDKGSVSLLVYNYEDLSKLGVESNGRIQYMCSQPLVYEGVCDEKSLGKIMTNAKPTFNMINQIVEIGPNENTQPVVYNVSDTGFYCVSVQPSPGHESMKFDLRVKFQNAYGHLSAEDYPLITFHFVQSLVYFGVMIIWTALLYKFWSSVLKVQLYLTAMGWLLGCEQMVVALYYYVLNKQGHGSGSLAMLLLTSLWGSGRLASTFFLLLIIACGYSVVHPSLGSKMWKCQLLGGLLFAFTFAHTTVEYLMTYSHIGGKNSNVLFNLSLLFFFPFMILLGINYMWILHSLKNTLLYLRSRKQNAKVQMYRFVTFVVIGSLVAILLQFVLVFSQFAFEKLDKIMVSYWKSEWVIYDGWPNIVYCIALFLIMYLWRPNNDNMRYAMSTQLAQSENDADEFEIGSLNGSDDELEVPLHEEEPVESSSHSSSRGKL